MGNSIIPVNVDFTLGNLVDNLDAVEESVKEYCDGYMSIAITEDNLKDGTDAIANIRKVKKTVDDERKAIKKKWNEPYTQWENRLKEGIFLICDSAVESISEKMQEYEDKRIKEREKIIGNIYAMAIQEKPISYYLTLDDIANIPTGQSSGARTLGDKWYLKTYDIPKIREDITGKIDEMWQAIEQIKAMHSKYEADGLEQLRITKRYADAVQRIRSMEEQEKRIIEQERIRRERREYEEREKERQRILDEERQKRALEEAEERAKRAVEEKMQAQREKEIAEQQARIAKENSIIPNKEEPSVFDWDAPKEKTYIIQMKVPENVMLQMKTFADKNGYNFRFKEAE